MYQLVIAMKVLQHFFFGNRTRSVLDMARESTDASSRPEGLKDWELLAGNTGDNGNGSRPTSSRLDPSGNGLALSHDSYMLRALFYRCRALQRRLNWRIQHWTTSRSCISPERSLARMLDINDQLARLFASIEALKEAGTPSTGRHGHSPLPGGPPNLLSLICTVRSGSRVDKHQAALNLAELAQNPLYLGEVLSAGGLHSLVHLYNSTSDWPEVEYEASRAIALLIPGIQDPSLLLRYSQGILGALHMVLKAHEGTSSLPVDVSLLGGLEQARDFVARRPNDSALSHVRSSENLHQRRHVVATALAHLAVTLQVRWKEPYKPLYG